MYVHRYRCISGQEVMHKPLLVTLIGICTYTHGTQSGTVAHTAAGSMKKAAIYIAGMLIYSARSNSGQSQKDQMCDHFIL